MVLGWVGGGWASRGGLGRRKRGSGTPPFFARVLSLGVQLISTDRPGLIWALSGRASPVMADDPPSIITPPSL